MVMHEALRHRCPRRICDGKLVALADSDPTAGVAPTALTDAGPSRKQPSPPRRSLGTPVSRCVQELDAQVPARGAIAVSSRCTCIDCSPRRV